MYGRLQASSAVAAGQQSSPCSAARMLKTSKPKAAFGYDVKMSQRLRSGLAITLGLLMALLSGCTGKSRSKSSTVVVRLVRDLRSAYGNELDRRILDFEGSNPRLPSGQLIVIQSESGDYKDMLTKQTSNSDAGDVVILDSPDDAQASPALQVALPQAANICAGVKACPANVPAIIPQQVTGDHRQAAQAFVQFLQKTPS
jgi:hypothetical protein